MDTLVGNMKMPEASDIGSQPFLWLVLCRVLAKHAFRYAILSDTYGIVRFVWGLIYQP